MTDAAQQRTNMVESQILTSDVTDRRILLAMGDLPRERFVPEALAELAYMDDAVPLTPAAPGTLRRWLMAPRVFAKLLQLADIGAEARVLDVGCGTGYSAAVLGRIAKSVVALECDTSLAQAARTTLAELALDNVEVAEGPLPDGAADKGPFDAIVLQGAVSEAPTALLDQLKDGGRLVAVMRTPDGLGKGTIWRRMGRSLDQWTVFDGAAPELPGFVRIPEFVL
jgi:protein-L-isoaspartate(D-aspartate) O-methyltransferase